MKIILGGLELRSEEQPESIPLGGEQSLYLEEFPGGNVGMQNMGPRFRKSLGLVGLKVWMPMIVC